MNPLKIIADAGSTKTAWRLQASEDSFGEPLSSPGLNPATCSGADALDALGAAAAGLFSQMSDPVRPVEVNYFGAGCIGPFAQSMEGWLCQAFSQAGFQVASASARSDMLGAAISLFGSSCGIACILGTGSNSCLYAHGSIRQQTPSLGYLLGDEGSGNALGRRLLSDIFKGVAPEDLRQDFEKEYGLSQEELIRRVYREPAPARWLASFAPFLHDRLGNHYVHELVVSEFRRFISRNLMQYPDAGGLDTGFAGSVAFHFRPQLEEACLLESIRLRKVMAQPLDGLCENLIKLESL